MITQGRSQTTTRFSYGDDPGYAELANYAWYGPEYVAPNHLICQKLPNPWGLYDMHGNVLEWCADWYSSSYPGGRLTDPSGAANGTRRVLRGGSMASQPKDCRSAYREWSLPADAYANAGLRVVLAPARP